MKLSVDISNVQHISALSFKLNLSAYSLTCIVGKNGSGKTTLIRALQNVISADTFKKTASPYIFGDNSSIKYSFDDVSHNYTFNENLRQLDCKTIVDSKIKKSLFVEQPIPHGVRFNHTQKLGNIDEELRQKISIREYSTPDELISFLEKIYKDKRFSELKEVTIKGEKFYFIRKEDDTYIREDYFSSGEYFVIHLYKLIQKKCSLIAIDELDISLDSSAQVHLIEELRPFCKAYNVNIVFTTHSLALMRTLKDNELHYMLNSDGDVSLQPVSYNYIRSLLFGFKGWDKYILVEDDVLKKFISFLLPKEKNHFTHKIIHIGGGTQVVSLLQRNASEEFFASSKNVIAILDGDQRDKKYCKNRTDTYAIPQDSVEKEFREIYESGSLDFTVNVTGAPKNHTKNLYNQVLREGHLTEPDIFGLVYANHVDDTNDLIDKVTNFLNP